MYKTGVVLALTDHLLPMNSDINKEIYSAHENVIVK